jgi:nicotinate-nucleotide adenylyltransferase
MTIGIFGGSFDPPHIGHLVLAAEAQAQLCLSRVLWVLTAVPPHKPGFDFSELNHRLDMVRLAIQDNPDFQISRVDIDRPPPHYSVDTLRLLSVAYPTEALFYLMGGDSLHDLPTWHAPAEFLQACTGIGVLRRPDDQVDMHALEQTLPGIQEKVHFIRSPLIEISSTDIRQRVSSGLPYRYFLPPDVYHLICERNLYRNE